MAKRKSKGVAWKGRGCTPLNPFAKDCITIQLSGLISVAPEERKNIGVSYHIRQFLITAHTYGVDWDIILVRKAVRRNSPFGPDTVKSE